MAKIRVTKEFRFEMAHALHNYNGLCKNIHGHSYIMYVTVMGEPDANPENSDYGMVIDFSELKSVVNREIVKPFDHSVVISKRAGEDYISRVKEITNRYFIVPYQPTCENLLLDFVERVTKVLPFKVKLYSLRLYETAGSFAEWYADDN
ncbi:6-carboxytetrahydropterin synthase [Marinilabiliaceae bacterium ANBcel2]|nr:6-carboxytetrahydropterin synthase [Marinilabiliaceae bacterium ANBcel2]